VTEDTKPDAAYCDKNWLDKLQAESAERHERENIGKGLFRTEQYAGHRSFREERAARMALRSIIDRCNERPWVPS
jgi:hypothetical protein